MTDGNALFERSSMLIIRLEPLLFHVRHDGSRGAHRADHLAIERCQPSPGLDIIKVPRRSATHGIDGNVESAHECDRRPHRILARRRVARMENNGTGRDARLAQSCHSSVQTVAEIVLQ